MNILSSFLYLLGGKMILKLEEQERLIRMFITTRKNKQLDELLQLAIYRPTLDVWRQLHQKILRMRSCKPYKYKLSEGYYPSYATEFPYYYYDCIDRSIYQINWRPVHTSPLNLPIGSRLYHLTHTDNVERIIKEGLRPSFFSNDGVYYGASKIYFSTQPFLDEDGLDPYLWNRVQLEVEYDGSYPLYPDWEYEHIEGNSMVYTVIDRSVPIARISSIQPKRKINKRIV
jgi:hypothetical protein